MQKLTLDNLDVKGKRVLMRVDFNVPLDKNQEITDDKRIRATLPSINYVLKNGGKLILMSHLGRPKGQVVETMRLKPVAKRLSELLKREVVMTPGSVGEEVGKIIQDMNEGDVVLLENLRFYSQEKKNEPEFSRQLASLGDVYVNDAFGTCHRAHASMVGVPQLMDKNAAGFLLKKEIEYLGMKLENPAKPFVAILGGAKISGKIDVIQNLMGKVDSLLIGGGMMFTFYKAMGHEIGKSLLDEERVDMAWDILNDAHKTNFDLRLPVDTVIADAFDNEAIRQTVLVDAIPKGWMGLDVGNQTIDNYAKLILEAKTIVWNGPMGVAEMPNFAAGTNKIMDAVAQATKNGAISIIGGGDTAAVVNKLNIEDQFSHVSTGGGASLEMLEGKVLPGLEALSDE